MNPTISNSALDQFYSDVRLAYQQMTTRIKGTITHNPLAAESGFFDFMGSVEAVQRTGRGQKVQETPPDMERRKCGLQVWEASIWEDKFEKKIINGPLSQKCAMTIAAALRRRQDQMICQRALGTAWGGREGTDAISFDSNQRIATTYREDGTSVASNITTGKIRKAIQMLTGAEALPDDDQSMITFLYSSVQQQSLLAICEAIKNQTAYDALSSGKATCIMMGAKWIRVADKILPKVGAVRSCIAYGPDSIQWCEASDVSLEVNYIPLNKSWLISGDFQSDAARVREQGVVEVLCDETTI